jgi:hypothetical protein
MAPDTDPIVEALHLAARTERAPAALRMRIDALQREHDRERERRRTRPRRRLAYGGSFAVALAALIVALALVLPGGSPGGPTIAQAAAIGARAQTGGVPAVDPAAPNRFLAVKVGSLQFPNWQYENGVWRAVGTRVDRLGSHRVVTVYYKHGTTKIAYSIVSVPALAGQQPGYYTFTQNGRTVVTWHEDGHSCVLSGVKITRAQLSQLAKSALRRTAS